MFRYLRHVGRNCLVYVTALAVLWTVLFALPIYEGRTPIFWARYAAADSFPRVGILSVPSIVSLQSGTFGNWPQLDISGYNAPLDGGGGRLTAIASGCTANGATIFQDVSGNCFQRQLNGSEFPIQMAGAKCDGTTNDSAAFTRAFAVADYVAGVANSAGCVIGNVVVGALQTFDGKQGKYIPASGSSFLIKGDGYQNTIKNMFIRDASNTIMASTTTSSAVSPGTNVIPVNSVTGFAVNQIASIQLASGVHMASRITAVGANSITLVDQVPSSATAISLASGGSGYGNNQGLVAEGGAWVAGSGGVNPLTLDTNTVSGGACSASTTISTPGRYSIVPSNPVVFAGGLGGSGVSASGCEFNVTWGGVSSGATVSASFGEVVVDTSSYWRLTDVTCSEAPGCLQILNTDTTGTNPTNDGKIDGLRGDNLSIFGMMQGWQVSNTIANNIFLSGISSYGTVGFYKDDEGTPGAVPFGGSQWNSLNVLNFEMGTLLNDTELDTFSNLISDTNRDINLALIGNAHCFDNAFTGQVWTSTSGPSANNTGTGVLMSDCGTNIKVDKLSSFNNAAGAGELVLDAQTRAGINYTDLKTLTGNTPITLPIAGGTTAFLGPAGNGNGWVVPEPNNRLWCFEALPGGSPGSGQSYTYTVYVNSQPTHLSGSISGSGTTTGIVCDPNGTPINQGDTISLQLVTSSSAASNTQRYFIQYRVQ